MTTSKYYLNRDLFLGSGAVGEVYVGHNKETGESVAMKTMRKCSSEKLVVLLELQERELEVLRKLDHPNIVKLIDVEPEQPVYSSNGRKIIIMELCTGGSLLNLLTSAENTFGFDDKEFLNVLKGIASGMEKLNTENIIHRDIKPGNIMRFIGEDGRTTYKLIDFGAARELQCGEQFESIYGTEEYLHPRMYEKAFIDRYSEQSFKDSVDLWSIGATLYHVAAGQIPFSSFKGREDRTTMHAIIANKESGDISGFQERQNGPIIYSKHLPGNCILSLGLRPHVELLLARLLEMDENKLMTFKEFFDMAKNIISKKVVSLFNGNSTDILKIYMDPTCNFQMFQDLVKDQTEAEPENQLLLYENLDFVEQFGGDQKVMTCGEVIESNPVYLFCQPSPTKSLDEGRTYRIPLRSTSGKSSTEKINFAKSCSETLNFIKRFVAKCILRQKLINSGAIMLIRFLSRKYDKFSVNLKHLSEGMQLNQLCLDNFELLVLSLLTSPQVQVARNAENSLVRQKALYSNILTEIKSLHDSCTDLDSGLQVTVNLWLGDKPMCTEDDCCLSRIDVAISNVKEIYNFFKKGKCEDEQSSLKCTKLEKYCNSAKMLIENHCHVNTRKMVDHFKNFLERIWPQKESLVALEVKLADQYPRRTLLFESMNESSGKLKKSLNLSALKLERSQQENDDKSLTLEAGKLIFRRRESVEKKFASQLYSINMNIDNKMLSSGLNPLLEENNKLLEGIMNMSVSGVDGKGKETNTFHLKHPKEGDDKTLV